jgi:sterol desaturase/sphingolipid hydroxylase (fatty acid hydroxylase superfamily)
VLKKKYTYGSYWTSLALPTVNGIGYFLIIYAQWEFAVVLCCKFISPTLEPFLTSPIFCISQRLIAELCWPSGFYHIHKLYHQPPYFGLVHFNHHLQNYVDWVDGIGEGPEEAPLSLASFHQWNPPNFLGDLPILWTFVLSVFDGTAHAYEPPETGSGVDEYKMDQVFS